MSKGRGQTEDGECPNKYSGLRSCAGWPWLMPVGIATVVSLFGGYFAWNEIQDFNDSCQSVLRGSTGNCNHFAWITLLYAVIWLAITVGIWIYVAECVRRQWLRNEIERHANTQSDEILRTMNRKAGEDIKDELMKSFFRSSIRDLSDYRHRNKPTGGR